MRQSMVWAPIALMALVCFSAQLSTASPPNIVFILADDLGYGDLGCYGHPQAKTPVLDKLAREGVRFTQHYANGPECSPTRTAFLTGRYQQRVKGLECAIGTGNVGRYDDAIELAEAKNLGLPRDKVVVPKSLQKQGYVCGVYGKWHLGYEPKFNPIEHGWDQFFGYLGGNVHYFNHRETSDLHVLFRDRYPVYRDGYMTHLITEDSIRFIRAAGDKPFFLYVAHECPHFPFQGPGDDEKLVTKENWMQRDAKAYVAMLEDLDAQTGKLLDALDNAGVRDNTLVVFVSDNGGLDGAAHMGPLKGAKSTTWEGGIRVPLIVSWPGRIEPGVSDQVSATFDLTRSFLNLAGADSAELDGYDIVGHLLQRKKTIPRTLFWRGKRGDRIWAAVRRGDQKLVRKTEAGVTASWLYNLGKDVGEEHDLSQASPQLKTQLAALLYDWEQKMDKHRRFTSE